MLYHGWGFSRIEEFHSILRAGAALPSHQLIRWRVKSEVSLKKILDPIQKRTILSPGRFSLDLGELLD
jgi:hypothetical protein